MRKRPVILIGMVAGVIWSIGLLWIGHGLLTSIRQRFDYWDAIAAAGFLVGLVVIIMIGRLAQRRFFDDTIIDGQSFRPGSGADIDQRVLTNTVEQAVLALCIWPFVGAIHGVGMVIALGLGFVIARFLFWLGYHLSPPLRAFGFAATFYPTVLAALWTIVSLAP